jgi:acetyl esterase/lipase
MQNAPWLTPARMLWYRKMYLPENYDASDWRVSPCHAPETSKASCCPTWIAIAEQDLLAGEAHRFALQLKAAGVTTTVKEYAGMTHSILALNGNFQT